MNKITDEEIIRAVQFHADKGDGIGYVEEPGYVKNAQYKVVRFSDILDLIMRLKGENVRLKKQVKNAVKDMKLEVGIRDKENAELQKQVDEYKAKIEQGTLVELPCKVGDSFYSYEGFKYQCFGVEIAKDGIYLRTVYDMKFLFGKDAFLTREEAEKRLKELQE